MKIMLTSICIALASASVVAAPAAPQAAQVAPAVATPSAQSIDLARRFVALTFNADQYIELMHMGATQMVAALSASFGDEQGETEGAQRLVERYLTAAEPKLRAHMPQLTEAYAQVYARKFSADELQQMIAFAQSPAGKRYLSMSDTLDLDPVILKAHEELGTELNPIMDQVKRDICAEKAAQRIAAGDTNAKCPLSARDERAEG
ncbi:DUF2059 domain-containing protein [Sphingomonas sp. RB56-2]|uniref:DUF2059 domain-containing protein n=1 Tax=Sphingomonas brevis TaxID=2908206 RepID=A0ABT0S817_9SPHN|nr:DUF2059 domain-containing protein [Sphingomonas brevis]MCL6740524.1 DUF2059 domain-containing protein [Sphingomonas brevis]